MNISLCHKSHIGFWSHSGELQVITKIADNTFAMSAFKSVCTAYRKKVFL